MIKIIPDPMRPLYIIAECAQGFAARNYDESIALALMLTRCAKSAGADAVKFQLVIASELATMDYKYFDLFKSLELGYSGWKEVSDLAKELKIDLVFDIFGSESLQVAESLGAFGVKLHPTDFTNRELIANVLRSPVTNVIAGCGGANYPEIQITVNQLSGSKSLTLLHGFQGYPTHRADNCLSRLRLLRDFIDQSSTPIMLGFADHADPSCHDSTHLAAASLGYGVSVIEKHLTIAKCLQLEDYESALSPDEFANFVKILRACHDARGGNLVENGSFELPESEKAYRQAVARHVVASSDLESGHLISPTDISLKRTSHGDCITDPLLVIGKTTIEYVKAGSPFTLGSLKK